ncbi:MAG: hypothetical protein IPM54_40685 [Polyangiaceae bacterium]|nr:hypothetical protein [Polyangiaceae bacterium]
MTHESVALLERRCFAVPELVRGLDVDRLRPVATTLQYASTICVTGIGASEGPARLLASRLSGPHRQAQFIPLSGLLAGDHRAMTEGRHASRLVVFSQALSPNAQMALEAGEDFTTTILVCGPDVPIEEKPPSRGLQRLMVIRHPPEGEAGFLLRVTGPAVASAVALALATLSTTEQRPAEIGEHLKKCADAMERRLGRPIRDVDLIERPPAFLVYGLDGAELSHLLRWTLLECLDMHDPSVWDVLSFAHGPFQSIFDGSRTLILPRAANDAAIETLRGRLVDMLRQTRHSLMDVSSELPRPWSTLEHLAAVHALVMEHLRKHPRDLGTWPGKGCDGPLYGLDRLP